MVWNSKFLTVLKKLEKQKNTIPYSYLIDFDP
jgi:hypothetical protein